MGIKSSLQSGILRMAEAVEDKVKPDRKTLVKKKSAQKREKPDIDFQYLEDTYRNDPIVGLAIDYTISFAIGGGINIRVYDKDGREQDIYNDMPDIHKIIKRSKPKDTAKEFMKDGHMKGNGYIELMKETGSNYIHSFVAVNPDDIRIERDHKGRVLKYVQEVGSNPNEYPVTKPYFMVHYKNRPITGSPYGISDIESIAEVSELLRDMQVDLGNFISTKAYPPTLWKLGTEDKPWGARQVEEFSEMREEPQPSDQVIVSGDISTENVGVADGTIDVEPYLKFYASMIVSGLRVPATLTSIITNIGQFTADSQVNAYARRINDIRDYLSELFEDELFNKILEYQGYSGYYTKVEFEKHDDEAERMQVNNMVQLVQNSVLTPLEAREELGYPQEHKGQMLNPIDNPESTSPARQPGYDQNDSDKVSRQDDGRNGSKRKNTSDQTET